MRSIHARKSIRKNRWQPQDYLPTPQEIGAKCREIQRGWSPAERLRRLLVRPAGWSPPVIHVAELGIDVRTCSAG
jgi:hypothetical protein